METTKATKQKAETISLHLYGKITSVCKWKIEAGEEECKWWIKRMKEKYYLV